jgi:hypothetical protein
MIVSIPIPDLVRPNVATDSIKGKPIYDMHDLIVGEVTDAYRASDSLFIQCDMPDGHYLSVDIHAASGRVMTVRAVPKIRVL